MKKNFILLLLPFLCALLLSHSPYLSASCQPCAVSECQTNSKTFFRPRPVIADVMFFLGLNQYSYYSQAFEPDDNYNGCNDENIHFAIGGLFEKSRRTANNNIGSFFFSGGITIDPTLAADPTILASIITLSPQRSIAGAYLDYHQDFWFCDDLWLDVKLAVYQATHNLCAQETILSSTVLAGACTPLNYLSSSALCYGRIATGTLKKAGIDDIELKLGYNFFDCDERGYVGAYGSVLFPTAPKPTAQFLFEPLVGRGHWGVGAGLDAAYSLHRGETTTWALLTDFSYQYLFKGNELRSLDFTIGQLSRYLAATTADNMTAGVPAINLTTLNLAVAPRGVINFWLASHLQRCQWHAEFGYNLWWKQAEKVCFQDCQSNNFNNFGVFNGTTFVPITLNNLDLASTSNPKTLTNKVYLALAYEAEVCCKPINFGLGGSYEFSRNINSLEQWGVWGNIEIGF